jgi:hypothetical protein
VVLGVADFAKGNRLDWPGVERLMPPLRLFGNRILTRLTRWFCGYPDVVDSQCGYTAVSRELLGRLDLDRLFGRYGYPNDLLGWLSLADARVVDVPVRPVYGSSWRSGIRPWTVIYPIAFVLLRVFVRRMLGRGRMGFSFGTAPLGAEGGVVRPESPALRVPPPA